MRPGRHMALAAGFNEFGGGLLLALGLLMPLAAVMIASTMLVASLTAHRGKGLWNTNSGVGAPAAVRPDTGRADLQRRRPVVARPRAGLGR